MARVGAQRHRENIYIYIYIYVHTHAHTHTCDSVQTVCELPLLPNNTAVKHFLYKIRSGGKC